jgi:hypothetical protein
MAKTKENKSGKCISEHSVDERLQFYILLRESGAGISAFKINVL